MKAPVRLVCVWVTAALCVGACSSNSDDSTFDATDGGGGDAALPRCSDSVSIGNQIGQDTYAGGACKTSDPSPCTTGTGDDCTGTFTIYTCTCSQGSWSCTITGGTLGSADCDSGSSPDGTTTDGDLDDADTSDDDGDAGD